jgi:predicted P-loop ATPase
MLILEGEQGTGKSSAVRILAGQWFDDTELNLYDLKDSGMQLRNVWLYEWGELAGLRRNEIARVKSWVSKRDDRFRAPYAPEVESQPRHCIFVGTCNPAGDYLADTTGNRRFWPAYCGAIDLKGLARDRDQLWAEANARYQAGAEWHLTGALVAAATVAQEARETEDPLQERAIAWVRANPGQTVTEILSGLGFAYEAQTHAQATRLGAALAKHCMRDRIYRGTQQVRTYRLRDM